MAAPSMLLILQVRVCIRCNYYVFIFIYLSDVLNLWILHTMLHLVYISIPHLLLWLC
jgi:hypothetical protein